MNSLTRLPLVLLSLLLAPFATAETMPQDSWPFMGQERLADNLQTYKGVAIGPDGLIYVGIDEGNYDRIGVYDSDLNELRRWGNFAAIRGMAVNSQNELHVLDVGSDPRVRVYDADGNYLRGFGAVGSAPGQFEPEATFASPRYNQRLCIGKDDAVAVIDEVSQFRVHVFDSAGNHELTFGEEGQLDGQFYYAPLAITYLDADGGYYIIGNRREFGYWDSDFNHVQDVTTSTSQGLNNLAVTPDGLVVHQRSSNNGYFYIWVYDGANQVYNTISSGGTLDNGVSVTGMGIGVLPDGRIVCSTYASLRIHPRTYYGFDTAINPTGVPLPRIVSVSQRPDTTLVDIDYEVVDADSSTVKTAMLFYGNPRALQDPHSANYGSMTSLEGAILPATFADGTEANLGENISANTVHRVTWDAGADWDTDVGNIKVEILAKDERGLMPLHWVTVPGDGVPDQTSSNLSYPYFYQYYSILLWLVATKDPSVELVNGAILGVGGAYDGQTLFHNFLMDSNPSPMVTAAGYDYVNDLIGVDQEGSKLVPAP